MEMSSKCLVQMVRCCVNDDPVIINYSVLENDYDSFMDKLLFMLDEKDFPDIVIEVVKRNGKRADNSCSAISCK